MFDAQLPSPLLLDLAVDRHDHPLNGFVERVTVGRRVVKPLIRLELVVSEVVKTGVLRDLRPQPDHLVEDVVDRTAIGKSPPGGQLPGLLAHPPVGLLLIPGHLLERLLATVVLDGHRPADLLVLLVQLGLLGLKRDVFFPEQLDGGYGTAVINLVPRSGQLPAEGGGHIAFVEPVPPRFASRLNLLNEVQISLLACLIIRLAGHRDEPFVVFLREAGGQFVPVQDPPLE